MLIKNFETHYKDRHKGPPKTVEMFGLPEKYPFAFKHDLNDGEAHYNHGRLVYPFPPGERPIIAAIFVKKELEQKR